MKKPPPRKTMAESEAVRRGAEARRTRESLVVDGISGPSDVQMLQPKDMAKINVDSVTYQRFRTLLVNELVHVIKNGGHVYDPITVCIRPDGTWWLVDGLQRFSAAFDAGSALPVLFYKSTGPQAEAMLFQAMNNRQNLTADTIVKSHQGVGAALLREVSGDPTHSLCNLIHFGGKGFRPYGAFILVQGLLPVSTGIYPQGKANALCARLDYALRNDSHAAERCRSLLAIIARVFPGDHRAPWLPVQALGMVAHRRWRHRVVIPSDRVLGSISQIPWKIHFPTPSRRFLPVLEAAIEKRWRAKKS